MLQDLHIENFVLIKKLDLEFAPGLNIFTGETGAGKSIVLQAISLLSGGRGFDDQVRSGTEEAIIEGAFSISGVSKIERILADKGVVQEDGLILSRRIQLSGPNRCRINGNLATLTDLTELGNLLMDIQSQGEHYSLLSSKEHLRILDAYAGPELAELKSSYQQAYHHYQGLRSELTQLTRSVQERARRVEMLEYQVREIEAAKVRLGEDVELQGRRNILRNAEKLAEESAKAYGLLKEGFAEVPGALDSMQEAAACLDRISRIDPLWEEQVSSYQDILASLEDVTTRLRDYLEELNFDSSELDELESRLVLIDSLKHKYGPELTDVLKFQEDAQGELSQLEASDSRLAKLAEEIQAATKVVEELGGKLREARVTASSRLESTLSHDFAELRLAGARFKVELVPLPTDNPYGEDGLESVEFTFSANPGEALRPIYRAASGGELSRLLLALKGALATVEEVPILIFDEIDTGTSGRTAQAIAERLFRLSRKYQVICVTHLPQIAAMADRHFLLDKEVDHQGETTQICVKVLDQEGRVNELARLLGGITISDAAIGAASDLIKQVEEYKGLY